MADKKETLSLELQLLVDATLRKMRDLAESGKVAGDRLERLKKTIDGLSNTDIKLRVSGLDQVDSAQRKLAALQSQYSNFGNALTAAALSQQQANIQNMVRAGAYASSMQAQAAASAAARSQYDLISQPSARVSSAMRLGSLDELVTAPKNIQKIQESLTPIVASAREGSRGILEMAAAFGIARIATDAFIEAVKLIPNTIWEGLKVIDKMRMSAASMAGAMVTNNPAMAFEDAIGRANAVVDKTFELSGRFVGNARDLQVLAEAMTTFGYKINLTTKAGQDQFITFGNILKLVTQGQNFEIQAFQELRALMMGQNFQGAMLARRLEAMGVNVKAMIPLWVEQGTVIENVVSILGGYDKASKSIADTMEAQRRTLESMVQKTLAIGMKEFYEDLTAALKAINKELIGEDGKGGLAKAMGESIRDAYRDIKAELIELPSIIRNVASAYKYFRDMAKSGPENASTSPVTDTLKWVTFRASQLAGGKARTFGEFMDSVTPKTDAQRQSALESYYGSDISYPAETISGRGTPPGEPERKAYQKFQRDWEDWLDQIRIRELKNVDEWAGKKLEAEVKNAKEARRLILELDKGMEERTLLPPDKLFKLDPDKRTPALQSEYNRRYAEIRKAQARDNAADIEKIELESSMKDQKHRASVIAALDEYREKKRKLENQLVNDTESFRDKYAAKSEDMSSALKKEEDSIDKRMRERATAADELFGAGSDRAIAFRVQLVAVSAELKLLASAWDEAQKKIASEKLDEQIADWRREAETPIKWPWNEEQVAVMEGITAAHEKYVKDLAAFRKTVRETGEDKDGARLSAGEKALKDRYDRAVKAVTEQNDTVMKVTADVWRGWFSSMEGSFTAFFDDALTGKLKSFRDYFQGFVNSLASIWAKGIAQMMTKSLEKSLGGGAQIGFGEIISFLGGMLGLGGSMSQGEYLNLTSDFSAKKDGGIFNGTFIPMRAFASGGIASRPTLGLIGEGGGPEAVIPLKGGAVPVSLSGGGAPKDVNVNFNIVAADTKDFDRLLSERRSLIAGIVRSELANASYMRDSIRRYA